MIRFEEEEKSLIADIDTDADKTDMTVDDIMREIADVVEASAEAKATFMWEMYKTLKVGSLFQAEYDIEKVSKHWYECNSFEQHLFEGVFQEQPILLLPRIEKGETVMFLGLSEEELPYETVEHRPLISRSRGKGHVVGHVVNSSPRKYPKWIIGEKVMIWPLDLTRFRMLVPGTKD